MMYNLVIYMDGNNQHYALVDEKGLTKFTREVYDASYGNFVYVYCGDLEETLSVKIGKMQAFRYTEVADI